VPDQPSRPSPDHHLNNPMRESASPSGQRPWWIAAGGVLLTLVGIQLLVTQPLARQLDVVRGELVRVESDMTELVGTRDEAWAASDLLSGLVSQAEQLDDAHSAVESIREFRELVENQAAGVEETGVIVGQLDLLHERLATGARGHGEAMRALNRLIQIRDMAASGRDQTDAAVSEIARLQAITSDLQLAHDQVSQLAALRATILAGGEDTERARVTLDDLVTLQDTLNTHSSDVDVARKNLNRLLTLEESLRSRSEDIASAVEALEVLTDLQRDIRQHVESLGGMRRDLMEVVLLQSTVARVVNMVGPLTELTQLRRLSAEDMREAARLIGERRHQAATKHAGRRNISDEGTNDTTSIVDRAMTATSNPGPSARVIPPNDDSAVTPQTADSQSRLTGDGLFDQTHRLAIDRIVPTPPELQDATRK